MSTQDTTTSFEVQIIEAVDRICEHKPTVAKKTGNFRAILEMTEMTKRDCAAIRVLCDSFVAAYGKSVDGSATMTIREGVDIIEDQVRALERVAAKGIWPKIDEIEEKILACCGTIRLYAEIVGELESDQKWASEAKAEAEAEATQSPDAMSEPVSIDENVPDWLRSHYAAAVKADEGEASETEQEPMPEPVV